jgi:hypothetical protein
MNAVLSRSSDKLRVIACGAIAREILAIKEANGLDHLELECLPAIWHVYPEKIAPAMRQKIAEARAEGIERIFIGYAECGTQGQLDKICEEEGVERIAGPHCYAFFTGTEKFLAECEHEFSAFYLTDLITRQFEAFVIEPLKLDKHPELRDMADRGSGAAGQGEVGGGLSQAGLRIPLHRLWRPDARPQRGRRLICWQRCPTLNPGTSRK